MNKIVSLIATTVLLIAFHSAHSEDAASDAQGAEKSPGSDLRQLVSMPDEARQLMRRDMLDHLSALNEIIAYLAENNLDAAAHRGTEYTEEYEILVNPHDVLNSYPEVIKMDILVSMAGKLFHHH